MTDRAPAPSSGGNGRKETARGMRAAQTSRATVVKLDRGFPLVECSDGTLLRCEHATALVKGDRMRAVIGDIVDIAIPESHDKGIIQSILPRRTAFVRKDPAERSVAQTLAANFDLVMIAEPIVDLNKGRLVRELVLAHETGARVAVILTKADLAAGEEDTARIEADVADLAGPYVQVAAVSTDDQESVERVRMMVAPDEVAILIGKSGVGKSSLINVLVGDEVQETGEVRERDGRGRHTTVDRVMVSLPDAGRMVDMPGVRGLGLWDAEDGITAAFRDIADLAEHCRFRDCTHGDEPGCAVREAVESGEIAEERLASYQLLVDEAASVRERREEARRIRGEKASDRRKRRR